MNFAGNTRLKDYISMKKFFNIIPGEDACCILLYGDIGDYDGNVRSGDIARELLEAEALSGRIDVRINSNGGEVYAGIAIFNALKNSKADITIYVDGIAASMASVIALWRQAVQMSRYARLSSTVSREAVTATRRKCGGASARSNRWRTPFARCMPPAWERTRRKSARCISTARTTGCVPMKPLALGLIDGIYDAAPLPEDSTPEQVFQIFNNRLPQATKQE